MNGELPSGGQLTVRVTRTEDSRFDRPAGVDARGHFLVEGLPAGTYEVLASAYWPGIRGMPPTRRQQITIADGELQEITLTLDLKPLDRAQ